MINRPPSSRAVSSLVSGALTAAYYATPDVLSSRTARGWAKAGLAAASLATSLPELRAARASWTEQAQVQAEGEDAAGPGSLPAALRAMPARGKAVAAGVAAVAVAGTVAGAVAGERWAFRRGQRRAAAGKRFPHTGPALVYGALTALSGLIPQPEERRG